VYENNPKNYWEVIIMISANMKKEISNMNLVELNTLMGYIRDVKSMNAKTSLVEGCDVYVVQKTKRTLGKLLKIKRTRCSVEMEGSIYSVPMSMLEVA
jgi:hypothetical protein